MWLLRDFILLIFLFDDFFRIAFHEGVTSESCVEQRSWNAFLLGKNGGKWQFNFPVVELECELAGRYVV